MKLTDLHTVTPAQFARLVKQAQTTTLQPRVPPQPNAGDVPRSWANQYLPPGLPLTPLYPMNGMGANGRADFRNYPELEPRESNRIIDLTPTTTRAGTTVYTMRDEMGLYTGKEVQFTPRSYQFPPNVNTTIIPRTSYGLAPFYEIQAVSEATPEVMMCLRLLKRIFLSLVPTVKHDDGEECHDPAITHIVTYPDGYHSLAQWLAMWFYNGLIYDAQTLHLTRDQTGLINGLVNIDGSTIFLLIDQNGNVPLPPAPAYLQIIWGTPYGFSSSEQLWYKPMDKHLNSPYGTPIFEAAPQLVQLLSLFWQYEAGEYTYGNMPETAYSAPPGWTPDQITAWLVQKNQALAGNLELRRQFDVWPDGFKVLQTKDPQFRKELKLEATRILMEIASLPISEIGEVGGQGLGGKGFMDAMQLQVYRQSLAPWMKATSQPFDDVFAANHQTCKFGKNEHHLEWEFPPQSIDPEKEQQKLLQQWQSGGMTWGAYLEANGQERFGDERDELIQLTKGATLIRPDGTTFAGGMPDFGQSEGENAEPDNAPQGKQVPPNGLNGKQASKMNGLSEKAQRGLAKLKQLSPETTTFFARPRDLEELADEDLQKHCGVCEEDEQYYGAPLDRAVTINMPHEGVNESEIVSAGFKGQEPRPFVFKPEGNEDEGLSQEIGHPQYAAEAATYLIDRALGFYLVPVSYVAEIDGERGAAIHYVRENKTIKPAENYGNEWVEYAAVLDYITGQTDRQAHNWLTHPDDALRPILIDNGLAFPTKESPRTVHSAFVDAWRGKPLSAECSDAVRLLVENTRVWQQVARLVGQDAADQAQLRARNLLGVMPNLPAQMPNAR